MVCSTATGVCGCPAPKRKQLDELHDVVRLPIHGARGRVACACAVGVEGLPLPFGRLSRTRRVLQARCVKLHWVRIRPPQSRPLPFPGPSARERGTESRPPSRTRRSRRRSTATKCPASIPTPFRRETPVYRSGSIGFLFLGTEANVKDLDITTPAGATLFANKLSRSTVLADFTGSDLGTPDPLPIILDGAKRDREDWSGDLGVSAAVDFYTTDADAYVRGVSPTTW